jgi:hypothetical protein
MAASPRDCAAWSGRGMPRPFRPDLRLISMFFFSRKQTKSTYCRPARSLQTQFWPTYVPFYSAAAVCTAPGHLIPFSPSMLNAESSRFNIDAFEVNRRSWAFLLISLHRPKNINSRLSTRWRLISSSHQLKTLSISLSSAIYSNQLLL